MVLTVGLLFSYFSKVLHIHGMSDKNPRSVASAIKVNPYFVQDYLISARNYPMKKVSAVIGLLREFDVKSKGVGSKVEPEKELLKELLIRILD